MDPIDWLRNVSEPGPHCLSADEMAAAIEGRLHPHIRTCPRCAAEYRALRPAKRKTRRYATSYRGRWAAAIAASLLAALAGWLLLWPRVRTESAPERVADQKSEPKPKIQTERPRDLVPRKKEEEKQPEKEKQPEPKKDRVVAPHPEDEPKPEPEKETTPDDTPARTEVAVAVRGGGISTFENGKWVKTARPFENARLRADGKTTLDFAGARVTIDASSKFTLTKSELALEDGGLSAEIPPDAKFALVLQGTAISRAGTGRVLLVAREDRVIVEEGSARAGGALLAQGVEHGADLKPRKGRSLPLAARPRETLTWRLDLTPNSTRGKLPRGKLQSRALVSTPFDNEYYYAGIQYFAGGDAVTFTVRKTTAIRFRYLLRSPAKLSFALRNKTKDENFTIDLEPSVDAWTTVTLFVSDIPVNTGGKNVECAVGDQYGWFGWSVGEPGKPAEVLIDEFQVLEIER